MELKSQEKQYVQSAQEQYPRKVGFVTHRLDDLKTAPLTKPQPKQKPYVITDWASI